MPLSIDTSQFSTNTPVIDLVNNVFIENWTIQQSITHLILMNAHLHCVHILTLNKSIYSTP